MVCVSGTGVYFVTPHSGSLDLYWNSIWCAGLILKFGLQVNVLLFK